MSRKKQIAPLLKRLVLALPAVALPTAAVLMPLMVSSAFGASTVKLAKSETQATPPTTWEKFRKKTRASIFSEVMSPAFEAQTPSASSTPMQDGKPNDPVNAFTIFQADYEFLTDMRFLYFQRLPMNFNSIPGAEGQDVTMWDPRLALRLTNVISAPKFISTLDFYTQPGFSKVSANIERKIDFGVQANVKYKYNTWTFGNIVDFRTSVFGTNGDGNDFSGYAAPYITKDLNSKFSTQTWFTFPWRHRFNTDLSLSNVSWNTPGGPYVQNGIGYSASDRLWLGALINNFILVKPTWENTWASLWVSVTLL